MHLYDLGLRPFEPTAKVKLQTPDLWCTSMSGTVQCTIPDLPQQTYRVLNVTQKAVYKPADCPALITSMLNSHNMHSREAKEQDKTASMEDG